MTQANDYALVNELNEKKQRNEENLVMIEKEKLKDLKFRKLYRRGNHSSAGSNA